MKARETQGMLLGLVGVTIFSLTLPMTRIVVAEFHPLLNGLGRALVAAVPAAALLAWRRESWPTWPQMKSLAVVSLGVIVAFPVFSAWAMKTVPASHGAIVNGLQPLAVAIYAAWLSRERPSKAFWASALAGSALVVAFALQAGGGALHAGDFWMLVAVGIGALGYAEGARLARTLGGWQVICWALVLSAPFLALPVGWLAWDHHLHHPGPVAMRTWLAFGYVTLFSQFIGFFAWYAGLAMGGTARVGQVQLLQIFFTIALSALLFGEPVAPSAWLYAAAVIATVVLGRRATVRSAPLPVRAA
ncbi:DMT family transporter [Paraburkholderia caballeronis]|uniref:Permease of the drug/metabolite transporter (DMT) superfamily n=1 Tax=Paraburkholderia caballeronis TaxID=416943 RepID=A0A1H7T5A2_9BURK|nr:DMT family transporter [Paraburkholderia caballeronis]PXW22746.1 drug/metabolite transporter (DMT)-like permease [Paraburkholderia caballeronis]PXW96849.1 drug/metabolite transporter (DMT)-like permease [Paraburkholderia caballeronis]RAJ93476.1 drug/metabolite transporter (DMT)-like permease [Paraburkholderia caballeronis]TDV12199.1 drug/metabolite transporter (DMT)-like permease [Paraburkholderia caballeronis]TDV15274.1 drug/metabolite transporter (DMT)-like permease [Paraburkholderia caba